MVEVLFINGSSPRLSDKLLTSLQHPRSLKESECMSDCVCYYLTGVDFGQKNGWFSLMKVVFAGQPCTNIEESCRLH